MALKVVGSGLGRTGTKSMQTALNMLGVGPCHHMVEVFAHPESRFLWMDAAAGKPDWDAIFAGYQSMVDYPGAYHWRAIAAHYPDAKVLHTVRDPDQWFELTRSHGYSAADGPTSKPGPFSPLFATFTRAFGEHQHHRAFMTDYFRRHTEEVVRTIPAERLLVYTVGDGWDPLCKFLGVPVPTQPYPSENSRADFIANMKKGPGAH